jgi:hypothetical protein
MTKPRPRLKNHDTPVTIESDGRTITGTWGVWAGRITVYSDSGKYRSRQVAKDGGPDTLQMIAESILRELTKDGKV